MVVKRSLRKLLNAKKYVFLLLVTLVGGFFILSSDRIPIHVEQFVKADFNKVVPCYSSHWIVTTKYSPNVTLSCAVTSSGWTTLYNDEAGMPESLGTIVQLLPADLKNSYIINPLTFILEHGAEVIYQVDDLTAAIPDLIHRTFDFQLTATGKGEFDPYRHFGQPSIRPQSKSSAVKSNISYYIPEEQGPKIIQIINNIHASGREGNVTLDARAPPVFITSGLWGPIDETNTLFLYPTLWAAIHPISMSVTKASTIRGYWAQRLLREIGGKVGFAASGTLEQIHGASTKSSEALPNPLLPFLEKWSCGNKFTFFQCAKQLSKDMADKGFWKREDDLHIESWFDFLVGLRYPEPLRKTEKVPEKRKNMVIFQPHELRGPNNSSSTFVSGLRQVIDSSCPNNTITFNHLSSVHRFDIVLIVVFNFPHYKNIPHLETLYSTSFHKIVYCGPNITSFKTATRGSKMKINFVEVVVNKGFSSYRCISAVMKMNFKTRGYLFLADDALLHVWNLHKLPLDKFWFYEIKKIFRNKRKTDWAWWDMDIGNKALNASLKTLKALSASNLGLKLRIDSFLTTLKRNTGTVLGAMYGGSDILYIPEKYSENTIFMLDVFSSNSLFLEIALPTLVAGLVPESEVYFMKGQYLWYDGKRNNVPQLFNATRDIFIHPVKLSQIKKSLNKFFCLTIFPLIFENRTKHNHR